MADSMLNRRSRTIVSQLKTLLEEYTAEQATACSLFETCVDCLERLPTLADASNYDGPLCQALRTASLDEAESKQARRSFRASSSSAATAAAASSDCLLPAIDEKEVSCDGEEGGGEGNDASADDDEEEADSLRDRLVARQLEVVDALCRALREALEGMERATAAAAKLADDGAALARDAAPGAAAAAASSGGAAPCAASTAASLADAARAMAATAACARAAAGAVEAGADVGGLRALLRTLRDSPCLDEDHFADAVDVVLATEPRAC